MNMFKNLRRHVRADAVASVLEEGDSARNEGRWADAARAYQFHLASSPRDRAIWVQLGHAFKEAGDLHDALDAYERAALLDPSDPDPRLHRAYLLKRMDRPRSAEQAFLELMRLSPSRSVMDELVGFGLGAEARRLAGLVGPADTRACYVEIKDLISYLEAHATLTGISRVVLGLVDHVLERMDDAAAVSYRFVWQSETADQLFDVSHDEMRRISRAVASGDRGAVVALVSDVKRTGRAVALGRGDVYLVPGAFWMVCDNSCFLPKLKRDGVLVGALIYDLIPVTHAQYCEASLTEKFNMALGEALPFLDFCLTISAYVAEELKRFVQTCGLPAIPVLPVPLAHETRAGRLPQRVALDGRVEDLCRRPFVLCVCTIEARKNHAYLLNIWHRLIDEGIEVPDLVFVGRIGWRVTDLMAQIQASNNLDGRLHILQGVSDPDLDALYEHCLFTAFPSFVEGWGLPVGESLSHGKLCVASSATSIPEVGGDLCVYVDPFNLETGHAAIRELVAEPSRLAEREAALRATFKPRTWADLGHDFFSKLDRLTADLDPDAHRTPSPRLAAGELMTMRRLSSSATARLDYVRNPLRLMFAGGWRAAEPTGTWMEDARARLCFRTDYAEGREATFTLHLSASPWVTAANTLRIWAGDPPPRRPGSDHGSHVAHPLGSCESFWLRVKGRVGAGGVATVSFLVEGAVHAEGASLPVAVRLHAVGYAACDDIAARMDLMESRGLCAA